MWSIFHLFLHLLEELWPDWSCAADGLLLDFLDFLLRLLHLLLRLFHFLLRLFHLLLRLLHLLLRLPDFPLISCLPGSLQVFHCHVHLHLCSCLLVQSKFQLTSCQGQGISLSRRTDSANENEKTGLFWGTKCSSPLQSEPGRQKRLTSDESCLSESQLFRLSFQVLSFQFLSVSFTFCLKTQNCWTLDDLSRANMSHATWHVDLQHAGAFKSKRSKIEATNKRKVAVEKREFNGW